MIALIIGMLVSLIVTLVGTPLLIRLVHKLHYGQYIRQDGPQSHLVNARHPHVGRRGHQLRDSARLGILRTVPIPAFGRRALLVRGARTVRHAVDGSAGFIDDFAKVRKKQNLGLSVHAKFIGQFIFATIYAFSR